MAASGPESRRGWLLALLGGLVWTLVLGAIAPTVAAGLDYVRLVEPYGEFFRQSLLRGELPWWNPYASLGRPFLADLQSLSFYPATWLVVPFGVFGGWLVAATLHGALGIVGFLRLGRLLGWSPAVACGAGVCFLFSAPLFARMQAGQVNYVYALCYLPLVLDLAARYALAPSRRGWVALAAAWALQLLCCHPQVFWLSALGAGLFVTGWLLQAPWRQAWARWWRAALGLAAASAASLALLGFVLLPFLQLVAESNRAEPSLAFSAAFGMQPIHWQSLVFAPRAGFAVNWEYDLHAGALVLLAGLAGLARVRAPLARGALALALGGAVIAAGSATPLFAWLYEILPGLANFRVPARAGVLLVLGLIVSAAGFLANLPAGRRRGVALGLLGLVVLAEMAFAVRGWKRLPGQGTEFPVEPLVWPAIRAKHLDRNPAPVRVSVPADLLRENSGMVHGYATPVGFESLTLARVWDYQHAVAGADPAHAFNTSPSGLFYDAAPKLNSLNLAIMMPRDASFLSVKEPADPRAYLVTGFKSVKDWRAAIAAVAGGQPIHREAVVEEGRSPGRLINRGDEAPGSARITAFTLNRVEVEVDSPQFALLVLAEAWYPAWRASVDGVATPCLPANGWMRAAAVPPGKHRVEFVYHESSFLPGCLLSLATAGLLLVLWFRRPGSQSSL
jgi:hypothetical protein